MTINKRHYFYLCVCGENWSSVKYFEPLSILHRSEHKAKAQKTEVATDANNVVSSVVGTEAYDATYPTAYSAAYSSYAAPAHTQNQWAAYNTAAQPVRLCEIRFETLSLNTINSYIKFARSFGWAYIRGRGWASLEAV